MYERIDSQNMDSLQSLNLSFYLFHVKYKRKSNLYLVFICQPVVF